MAEAAYSRYSHQVRGVSQTVTASRGNPAAASGPRSFRYATIAMFSTLGFKLANSTTSTFRCLWSKDWITAASTMRSIVVDSIRRRRTGRRGGDVVHVTLGTQAAAELGASEEEILEVHSALDFLAKVNPRLAQVVEMRYFLGLPDEEIGAALGASGRTIRRDWERARLLLASIMER